MSAGSKYFFIVSKLNGMVLDLAGHGREPGSKVVTWNRKPSENDNQLWFEDPVTRTIRSKEAPSMCLDVPEGDNNLQVNPVQPGKPSQRWTIHEDRVQNYNNPKRVLDIASGNQEEGARICAWDWHGGNNQRFEFSYMPKKYFYIKSKMNGKVLDIEGAKTAPGARVIMWDKNEGATPNQLWYEDRHGFIRSKLNDLVLDSSGDGMKTGQYRHNDPHHQWCIQEDKICNASEADKVLDICEACHDNGAKLIGYPWNGDNNQRWELVYA